MSGMRSAWIQACNIVSIVFFVFLVVVSRLERMGAQMRYVTADNQDFLLTLVGGLEK